MCNSCIAKHAGTRGCLPGIVNVTSTAILSAMGATSKNLGPFTGCSVFASLLADIIVPCMHTILCFFVPMPLMHFGARHLAGQIKFAAVW